MDRRQQRFIFVGQLITLITVGCLTLITPVRSEALPNDRQQAQLLREKGLMLREQGQYEAAIAVLQKAVTLEPESMEGQVLLGWTQHRAGQTKAAAETLGQAVSRNPVYVPALNALGIVYLVNSQPTRAVLTHTWAAFLNPGNEIAYYNLSLALQRLQDYEWAVKSAHEAIRLEPTNPHPLIALAIAAWSQGDRSGAQSAYRQAIILDSRYGNSDFLPSLVEAAFSADQIQLALQILQSIGGR
jgi:Flp pilus assembly protein TadD